VMSWGNNPGCNCKKIKVSEAGHNGQAHVRRMCSMCLLSGSTKIEMVSIQVLVMQTLSNDYRDSHRDC